MKAWMLLGGMIGFLIGISFGLAQGSAWPSVIWRASAAAFVGGILLRWWGRMWVKSLQDAHHERLNRKDDAAGSGRQRA